MQQIKEQTKNIYLKEDIVNALRGIYMASNRLAMRIDNEEVKAYQIGFNDAIDSLADAFGISSYLNQQEELKRITRQSLQNPHLIEGQPESLQVPVARDFSFED